MNSMLYLKTKCAYIIEVECFLHLGIVEGKLKVLSTDHDGRGCLREICPDGLWTNKVYLTVKDVSRAVKEMTLDVNAFFDAYYAKDEVYSWSQRVRF